LEFGQLVIVRQKALADPPIFVAENLIGYCLPRQVFSAGRGILVIDYFSLYML